MAEGERTTSVKTWRDVLADYRYLRATLNALVQLDRQLSIDELVGSALNHDTMHGDTVMAILAQFEARLAAAERKLDEANALLRRLEQWDHMQSAGDGPYWLREIAAFLRVSDGK